MRYFKNIPEDFLRSIFAYDPTAPSGLVRLRTRPENIARHVLKPKGVNGFHARIKIDGKQYHKRFSFGKNGKSEQQAESEAHAFIEKTKKENPEPIKTVGCKNKGYWQATISYKGKLSSFSIHRLVFFLCNENIDIEKKTIDHIDNNPSNNRKENLRDGTKKQNAHNFKLSKRNKSGTKGIFDNEKERLLHASVAIDGKNYRKSFSYRSNPELKAKIRAIAVKWLRETRERLHGEFANHG